VSHTTRQERCLPTVTTRWAFIANFNEEFWQTFIITTTSAILISNIKWRLFRIDSWLLFSMQLQYSLFSLSHATTKSFYYFCREVQFVTANGFPPNQLRLLTLFISSSALNWAAFTNHFICISLSIPSLAVHTFFWKFHDDECPTSMNLISN
jgi:hypothetical protein